MTNTFEQSPARRFDRTVHLRWATVLVLGAPLLGGCAASHVGDAWQCPLVQGRPCVSVAGADPAAPGQGSSPVRSDTGGGSATAMETPLYRTESTAQGRTARTGGTGVKAVGRKCRGGCRPSAWLRRIVGNRAQASAEPGVSDPASEHGGALTTPHHADNLAAPAPPGDDLRTPEVIGRIWIAPYVDAEGVYHEAGWVRAVFEPAGWKLP